MIPKVNFWIWWLISQRHKELIIGIRPILLWAVILSWARLWNMYLPKFQSYKNHEPFGHFVFMGVLILLLWAHRLTPNFIFIAYLLDNLVYPMSLRIFHFMRASLRNEHFMSSFSGQFVLNNCELMEMWAHNDLRKESLTPLLLRYMMASSNGKIFSVTGPLCGELSPASGEFPSQRPVTGSFVVLFHLRPNKRLSKQSWGWWFETPLRSIWRHCYNAYWSNVPEKYR